MKRRMTGVGGVAAVNSDGHVIGLDIGATFVRAAVLALGEDNGRPAAVVHGFGQVALPVGAVVNGVVTDQAVVTAALKHLWQAHRFDCRNVILGITNPQVVVRDMSMPNLAPEQLVKALPFQAREIVALPIEEVLIDFAQLGEIDPTTDRINGLLIATPRQPVLAAVTAVERAGLKIARVDLSSFAALRSIADERISVEAVIDIGAHMTNVVIHKNGVPRVVRTVARGGQELTDRLAQQTGLSLDSAETIKREAGLFGRESKIADNLLESLRPLLAEIRGSIHYFSSTNEGAPVQRVSLTGGTAGLPGLAEVVAEQLGLPAGVASPTLHLVTPNGNRNAKNERQRPTELDHATSAVAVGLAMGAAA